MHGISESVNCGLRDKHVSTVSHFPIVQRVHPWVFMSAYCVFPGESKASLSLGGGVEAALRWGPKGAIPPPSPRLLCVKLLHPDHS